MENQSLMVRKGENGNRKKKKSLEDAVVLLVMVEQRIQCGCFGFDEILNFQLFVTVVVWLQVLWNIQDMVWDSSAVLHQLVNQAVFLILCSAVVKKDKNVYSCIQFQCLFYNFMSAYYFNFVMTSCIDYWDPFGFIRFFFRS